MSIQDDDKARAREILEAMNRLTVDPAIYIARCLADARLEGYQSGVEDAANFIQTSPHYFAGIGDEIRVAEDMRTMLLGVKGEDKHNVKQV